MCMEEWLIIYDKKDYSFVYDFTKEIGLKMFRNYSFLSLGDNTDNVTQLKKNYKIIFIAIWDTDKIIKCASNLPDKILKNSIIYSCSTTDLSSYSVRQINVLTLDEYYIDVTNEILYGKVKNLAVPCETIACYDNDNKRSVCLEENTQVFSFENAVPGSYVPSYGIEKKTQWRKDKSKALKFSNLALREAVREKKVYLDESDFIYIEENNERLYANYYPYKINIPDKLVFAFAGVINNEGILEINNGSATATLVKIIS